jgi:hypothetical protein
MVKIPVPFSPEEILRIRNYAAHKGQSPARVIRDAILERIEDEIDMTRFDQAYKEHTLSLKTYSLLKVKKKLGL